MKYAAFLCIACMMATSTGLAQLVPDSSRFERIFATTDGSVIRTERMDVITKLAVDPSIAGETNWLSNEEWQQLFQQRDVVNDSWLWLPIMTEASWKVSTADVGIRRIFGVREGGLKMIFYPQIITGEESISWVLSILLIWLPALMVFRYLVSNGQSLKDAIWFSIASLIGVSCAILLGSWLGPVVGSIAGSVLGVMCIVFYIMAIDRSLIQYPFCGPFTMIAVVVITAFNAGHISGLDFSTLSQEFSVMWHYERALLLVFVVNIGIKATRLNYADAKKADAAQDALQAPETRVRRS